MSKSMIRGCQRVLMLWGAGALSLAMASSSLLGGRSALLVSSQKQTGNASVKWVAPASSASSDFIAGVSASAKPLSLCIVRYHSGVQPGWTVDRHHCVITYGGQALSLPVYKVLKGTKQHLYWVSQTHNYRYNWQVRHNTAQGQWLPGLLQPPQTQPQPVITGYEHRPPNGDFHTMMSCRVMLGDGMRVGKVIDGRCNVAWNKQELVLSHYQVLYFAPVQAPIRPESSQLISPQGLISPADFTPGLILNKLKSMPLKK